MFTKHDIEFDEMAADSVRRRAMIAGLSWRRVVAFWAAMVNIVGVIFEICIGGSDAVTMAVAILGAAIFCSLYVKMESDLRLLRFIERLQKGGEAKTTA
jgi:Flp pilus assembly protein TadB